MLTIHTAIKQFAVLLRGNAFDFRGFEILLRDQQQLVLLHQANATEGAAQQSRLQTSLYQQAVEQQDGARLEPRGHQKLSHVESE